MNTMNTTNTRGTIRLTEEMLEGFGFLKIAYTQEETGKEFYHYELPLTQVSDYSDLCLITNASDEDDFPVVQLFGASEYEFHFAEPIIVLMNILQSNCVVEGFQLDKQFTQKDDETQK